METGMERQLEIYRKGLFGMPEQFPVDAESLEAAARAAMKPEAYDYVAGSERLTRLKRLKGLACVHNRHRALQPARVHFHIVSDFHRLPTSCRGHRRPFSSGAL
jgi:hypothetical protein